MSWPAVRTEPLARDEEFLPVLMLAGLLNAWMVVPALAFLLLLTLGPASEFAISVNTSNGAGLALLVHFLTTFVSTLAFSPFLSWFWLLVSLPVVWLALRFGWSGWLTATTYGALLALVVMYQLDFLPGWPEPTTPERVAFWSLPVLVGAFLGGAFWMGMKLAAPESFRCRVHRTAKVT